MRYIIDKAQTFHHLAVKDENENVLYKIMHKKGIHMGYQTTLVDADEQPVYGIEKKGISTKYHILDGETEVGTIKPKLSILGIKVAIESTLGRFEADGKIHRQNYTISKNGKQVAVVSKKAISLKNEYYMDTDVKEDLPFLFAIAIILCQIDYDKEEQARQNN